MPDIVNAVLLRHSQVLLARAVRREEAAPECGAFLADISKPGETVEHPLHRELAEEIGIMPMAYQRLAVVGEAVRR
jgi:NADH pyrophosphatase NudC (nudix superfamily)